MTYTFIHIVRFVIFVVVLVISFIASTQTHAYFTTNQRALNLGDGSALFLIDFSFGMKNHEVQIPIFADNDTEMNNTSLSYTIFDEDDNVAIGNLSAIVLSDAQINDEKMYVIPKNHLGKFTLMAVFTPTVTTKVNEYRLQVTHLPFNFDGTQQLGLNPSELRYYTTSLLPL